MTTEPNPDCLVRLRYLVAHHDTDESGVMHFARFPALIETAVLAGLDAAAAGLTAMREEGCGFAVTDLRVSYVAPAVFLDRLDVTASTEHVGLAHIRMTGTVERCASDADGRQLLASARLVMGAVNLATRSAARLPPTVRAALLTTRKNGGPR